MNSNTTLLKTYNDGKLGLLKQMLLENIQEESAKASGTVKPLQIIKSMYRHMGNGDERMKNKVMQLNDGRYCFVDGHRFFIADTDLGFEERGDLHVDQMLPEKMVFDSELIINIAKVKEQIALNKVNKNDRMPIVYECDGYKVGLNPKYVKDLVDFSGITTLKYNKSLSQTKSQKTPLFALNDENKVVACVLPVMLAE